MWIESVGITSHSSIQLTRAAHYLINMVREIRPLHLSSSGAVSQYQCRKIDSSLVGIMHSQEMMVSFKKYKSLKVHFNGGRASQLLYT